MLSDCESHNPIEPSFASIIDGNYIISFAF